MRLQTVRGKGPLKQMLEVRELIHATICDLRINSMQLKTVISIPI